MNIDLSKYDNSWYDTGGSLLKRALWYYTNIIFFKSHFLPFSAVKVALLRLFGAKVGKNVVIKPGVNIKYPWKLSIGNNSWIGENVWIDNLDQATIGSNCCLSQGSMLLCGDHNYKSLSFDLIIKPITLCDGAWIAAQSLVCLGVTIGENAILTAGSVATSDLLPNTINQGVPAQPKRKRIKI